MDDDTTDTPDGSPATATAAGAAPPGAGDEAAAALAEMRARLDEATADIERLATALEERTQALDEVETMAEVLLGAAAAAVVVVRGDRRVRALSPAAAELLGVDSSHVGRALASVVPDEVLAVVRPHLGGDGDAGEPADGARRRARRRGGGRRLDGRGDPTSGRRRGPRPG